MTLVRSKLEYGQSVWSPHTLHNIRRLEQVQRNATRYVNGFKSLSYAQRLKKLGLPTLVYRRLRGDMIEVYKILHGSLDQSYSINLPSATNYTRGHDLKLFKRRAVLDIRKFNFSLRIVNHWNALPQAVVSSTSVNQFKGALDRHWNDLHCKFNFE